MTKLGRANPGQTTQPAPLTPAPTPTPGTPPPRTASGPILDLIELVYAPLGKLLKVLFAVGGVRFLHAIVIYPLWIALLVGFWLTMWAKLQVSPLKEIRDSFVALVQEGFSVADVAESTSRRDSSLIDYVQTVEFELTPRAVERRVRLAIEPNRLVKVTVDLDEPTDRCRLGGVADASGKVTPVTVSLFAVNGRAAIATMALSQSAVQETHSLDADWWTDHQKFFNQNKDLPIALGLRRSDDGKNPSCAGVRGVMQIRVFKTQVKVNSPRVATASL